MEINRKAFCDLYGRVVGLAGKKTTMAVFNAIYVSLKDKKLSMTATDGDTVVRAMVNIENDGVISFVVPAKQLGTVKKFRGETLDVTVKDIVNVTIVAGKSVLTMAGYPVEDFPFAGELIDESLKASGNFEFVANELNSMLNKVTYAREGDVSGRLALRGVNLSVKEGKVTVIATDGRRLSLCNGGDVVGFSGECLLNSGCVEMLVNFNDKLNICFNGTKVCFANDEYIVLSNLIDAKYPDVSTIFPKEMVSNAIVDREELIKSLDIVSAANSDNVTVSFNNGAVKLCQKDESNEFVDEIDCVYSGEEVVMIFNASYFVECLKNLDVEKVTFNIAGATMPLTVLDGAGFNGLIMPLKR